MEVFLEDLAWSMPHGLRAGWWWYHIFTGLAKKKKLAVWWMRSLEILKKRWKVHSKPCQTFKIKCFAKIVNSFLANLRSLIGFWMLLWHHYISYYYVAIITVNNIFTTASFISLCLLLMFHIRFIKISTLFSKLIFLLLPFFWAIMDFEIHWGQITKTLIGLVYQMINADRYINIIH